MSSFIRIQFFVAITLLVLLSQVIGHSYVTSPTTRSNQKQSNAGCRGPSCRGPCDVPLAQKSRFRPNIVVARGDVITVEWPRNNHAGGFIRLAWAPTAVSDSHAAFDAHVQQINCHEVGGCGPDNAADPNGGDSGPADGSSRACKSTIQVPADLTDGEWTLQWAWFGGAFSLGDYYSCVDYTVSGGSLGLMTPVFIGGDYTYPGQPKCKFFNTDKLHQCTNEPCNAPIYQAGQERSGAPAAGQLGAVIPVNIPANIPANVPANVPASPVPASSTSTTGRPLAPSVPVTPSPVPASSTSTTGRPAPVVPSTPTPVVPSSVPSSPSSSSAGGNCALARSTSSSQATMIGVDTWGSSFHAIVTIRVDETVLTDWVLEVSWPSTTRVSSSFNAGTLQCEASNKSYFRPSAFWANNLPRGSVAQVEFVASNPNNLNSDDILANTRLRVLKMM